MPSLGPALQRGLTPATGGREVLERLYAVGRGGGGGGTPRVTFRRVVVSLRGPGQSPVRPFACCVGSLRSVGCCGRCSCWCPPPPPPDPYPPTKEIIVGKYENLPLGKSGRAIFGMQTFGSQTPPSPASNTSLTGNTPNPPKTRAGIAHVKKPLQ